MNDERSPRQLKLRTSPLSVSFSVAEREAVISAAYLSGDSVSAFIRDAAVKAAGRIVPSEQKRAA
jgi:uncharacterized protein (DUF1778 family)